MKQIFKTLLLVLLTSTTLVSTIGFNSEQIYAASTQEEISAKEKELSKAKSTLEAKKSAVKSAKKKLDSSKKTYDKIKSSQDSAQKTYNNAKSAYNKALKKNSALGFYKEYKYDVAAYNLENSQYKKYTNIGSKGDATSLDNMLKAVEYIKLGNKYRKKDGVAEIKYISPALMAIEQINVNYCYANKKLQHLSTSTFAKWPTKNSWISYGENLAYNYQKDPYDGWYTQEKKLYKAGTRDFSKVGHYLNLVNKAHTVTGFAYNNTSDIYYGQIFGRDDVQDKVKIADFEKQLRTFIDKVSKEISSTKKALDKAKTNLDNAKKATSSAKSNYDKANTAYKKAVNEQKSAQNKVDTLTKELDKLKKEKDSNVAVSSLSLNKTSLTLEIGKTHSLTTTIKPNNATNKTLTYSSSNSSIASVSSSGKITAKKAGKVTITVKSNNGKTATCKVEVKETKNNSSAKKDKNENKVTGLQAYMYNDGIIMMGGYTGTIFTEVITSDGSAVIPTFTSSDPSVATVTNGYFNATVMPKKPGVTFITVKAGNYTKKIKVTVKATTHMYSMASSLSIKIGKTRNISISANSQAKSKYITDVQWGYCPRYTSLSNIGFGTYWNQDMKLTARGVSANNGSYNNIIAIVNYYDKKTYKYVGTEILKTKVNVTK